MKPSLPLYFTGCLFVLLTGPLSWASSADDAGALKTSLFATGLTAGLEIITEVSSLNPVVGEQFSVIFKLRALRPVAAIDVDPQQYSGFWTEPAPLPEASHAKVIMQDGRPVGEYLLRQVVAFPLRAGSLELPPLRLKVRLSNSPHPADGEWDVIGTSKAVRLKVNPIPVMPNREQPLPLVGELEGFLSEEQQGSNPVILLEMKGTVNLALMCPEKWLPAFDHGFLSVRLRDWDNMTQTRDSGNGRRIVLLQQRRWTVRIPEIQEQERVLEGFDVPVFSAETREWRVVRIKGLPSMKRRQAAAAGAGPRFAPETVNTARSSFTLYLIAVFLPLVSLLSAWIMWRIWKRGSKADSAEQAIALLEKSLQTSPRAFLEAAHKTLISHARDWLNENETSVEECRRAVQCQRFASTEPSPAMLTETFNSLCSLLQNRHPDK